MSDLDMSRRDFIKKAASVGGVLAAATMASGLDRVLLNNVRTENIKQINGDLARRGIFLSAASGIGSLTSGASYSVSELATNKQNIQVALFDATTKEYLEWSLLMPDNWDGGTITAIFYWTHAATTTNYGVRWGCQGRAYADSDALDASWGTAQEVTDTGGTTDDVYISPETSAITLAGSPSGGQFVQLRAYRDPNNAADNLAIDAGLIGVKLEYATKAYSD